MSEFYKTKLDWTDEFVKNNIEIIEKNYSKFPDRNRWNCNVHAIHEDDSDALPLDYSFLRKEYDKVVEEFCRERGHELKHISIIWYNYYKTNQYQEPHRHGDPDTKGFTAVHYMIFDKDNHFETRFADKTRISPTIEQGDILLFPCNWLHYVPPNHADSPRLTVAFTLVIK